MYGTPLSLECSPDVTYHYDQPSPEHPTLGNMRGRLSWVEDLSGAEFMGYNARGDLETTVKRVSQTAGGALEYTTTLLVDSLGRAYQMIYPDGGVVRQEYNTRGFLHTVPGPASCKGRPGFHNCNGNT